MKCGSCSHDADIRDESKHFSQEQFRSRLRLVLVALVLVATGLVARAVDLQVLDEGFLEGQGDARYTRVAKLTPIAAAFTTATANR